MVTDGRDRITPILRASLAAGMTTRRLQASCPPGLQVPTQSSTDNDVPLYGDYRPVASDTVSAVAYVQPRWTPV